MRTKKRIKKHFCKMCGMSGDTEIHHIYPGAHRKKSDEYDFVIEVCRSCHRQIHNNPDVMRALKRKTQTEFEKKYSHEEFIRRMGKSWL